MDPRKIGVSTLDLPQKPAKRGNRGPACGSRGPLVLYRKATTHRLEDCMHDIVDPSAAAGAQKRRPVEERIGFIGLGRMGAAMASNLVQAGCEVKSYVRRPERTEQLAALGLEASTDIASLFNCEIVISML